MADILITVTNVNNSGKAWTTFRPNLSRQRTITRRLNQKLSRGCKKAADFLLEKSREIVPIDTSLLHDTSRVTGEGNIDKGTKTWAVVYDQEYAAIQHENLLYKHKPGKSAKYLEKPARIYRRVMANMVAQEVRQP